MSSPTQHFSFFESLNHPLFFTLMQGKIKQNDFFVVEWNTTDGQQLEVISVKKLSLINSEQAGVGADVKMQYNE